MPTIDQRADERDDRIVSWWKKLTPERRQRFASKFMCAVSADTTPIYSGDDKGEPFEGPPMRESVANALAYHTQYPSANETRRDADANVERLKRSMNEGAHTALAHWNEPCNRARRKASKARARVRRDA